MRIFLIKNGLTKHGLEANKTSVHNLHCENTIAFIPKEIRVSLKSCCNNF